MPTARKIYLVDKGKDSNIEDGSFVADNLDTAVDYVLMTWPDFVPVGNVEGGLNELTNVALWACLEKPGESVSITCFTVAGVRAMANYKRKARVRRKRLASRMAL